MRSKARYTALPDEYRRDSSPSATPCRLCRGFGRPRPDPGELRRKVLATPGFVQPTSGAGVVVGSDAPRCSTKPAMARSSNRPCSAATSRTDGGWRPGRGLARRSPLGCALSRPPSVRWSSTPIAVWSPSSPVCQWCPRSRSRPRLRRGSPRDLARQSRLARDGRRNYPPSRSSSRSTCPDALVDSIMSRCPEVGLEGDTERRREFGPRHTISSFWPTSDWSRTTSPGPRLIAPGGRFLAISHGEGGKGQRQGRFRTTVESIAEHAR